MTLDFNKIIRIKDIRIQKSELTEEENNKSCPVLTDIHLIPMLYEWFKDILANMDFPPLSDSVRQRKKFLFIILFLYSPGTLAGGKTPNGLRLALCQIFPDIKPCVISNNIKDVSFIYQIYDEDKSNIDNIYTEIVNRLKVKGLIK